MAKEIKKIEVEAAEVLKPNRVVFTKCKRTVRIPHNVDLPDVGDKLTVGEDWIGKFERPVPLTPTEDGKKVEPPKQPAK